LPTISRDSLSALAEAVGATKTPPAPISELKRPGLPTGAVTTDGIATVLAALLPENAVVADESITAGRNLSTFMMNAAPHDWLQIRGGSIGWGLPAATGAASPSRPEDRRAEGDGSDTRCRRCGRWRVEPRRYRRPVRQPLYQIPTASRQHGRRTPGQRRTC
jgi:TPP-dependent 2-oxoacid decarboxylase